MRDASCSKVSTKHKVERGFVHKVEAKQTRM